MNKYNIIRFTISDNDFDMIMRYTADYVCKCLNYEEYRLTPIEDIIKEFWNLMHIEKSLVEYFNKHLKIESFTKFPDGDLWDNGESFYIYYDKKWKYKNI